MADSTTDLPRIRLLRELYFNRTGVLLLLTILLTIGMYALAAHTHGNASAFWLTLATGIVATSAYAAIAVFLTTRQFDAFLQTTIEQSVRANISIATNELLSTIWQQNSTYLPTASYPPTNSPDPVFNRDLNSCFASSDRYIFQGVTARYSLARLASLDTTFDLVRIIVANPTEPDSVVTRAKHAKHSAESSLNDADLAHIRAELIDDIWMSIVGAFLFRRKCDRIEFCFLADPPIDRAEIFDTAMFLTRYSDPGSWGFQFPATNRFHRDSMPYQMLYKDCARLFTSKYTVRLQIPREDDPKTLFRALRKAGLDFDENQYERLQDEFRDLTRNLPDQMMPDSPG
jgi:hypothetical protein